VDRLSFETVTYKKKVSLGDWIILTIFIAGNLTAIGMCIFLYIKLS